MEAFNSSSHLPFEVIPNKRDAYPLQLCIAGINIQVSCLYHQTRHFFSDYLSTFEKPDFILDIVYDDICEEKKHFPNFIVPNIEIQNSRTGLSYDLSVFEPMVIHRKLSNLMPDRNIFLMHGAAIAFEGYAYLFCADSGVGKTTRAKIWLNEFPESYIINGDKPYIRVDGNRVFACGSPWCGKEGWNKNIMVPLRAIFFLERADGSSISSIEEYGFLKAFPLLMRQTFRPTNEIMMQKTIKLLSILENRIKCFKLYSTCTSETVHLAYNTVCMG